MKKYFEDVKNCPLFFEITETQLPKLLNCLSASQKHYEKDNFIFMAGEPVKHIGIVLSGNVHIVLDDFWGNRTIIAEVGEGGLFGEAFSCADIDKLPVTVLASEPCDILLIDYQKIVVSCPLACEFHAQLIKNMLKILAGKNVMLTQKIEFLTKRTTREKLMSYLSWHSQKTGSNEFSIPFDRQELAEYLSVDRSAMSKELSKMRNEGVLTFQRNKFKLL